MTDFIAPRIRYCPDPAAPALSAAVDDALDMLTECHRVTRARAGGPADIVHSVGASVPVESTGITMHSINVVPLQPGQLTVSRAWVRNQRRRLRGKTLLVHGVTAARLVLGTELAPRGDVHCLPVLAPHAGQPNDAVRATLRSELGIAPGAHMVLGYDAARTRSEGTGWYRHLQAADRRDIALVRIHAPSGPGWAQPTVRVVGPRGHSALPLAALLAASDVFVTTDRNLHAFSFAVAAVEQGVPVVTTTIDTAADLVLALGCGAVVPPMAHAVAGATLSLLNDGRRRPAHVPAPESPHRQIADLGRALLTAYRRVLRAELVGGAA